MKPFKWLEPSEKEIEDAILSYLSLIPGCFAFKVQTQGTYDVRKQTFRRQSKWVVRGCADVLVCFRGLMLCLEIKSAKGRQSDHQKAFETRIKSVGGRYWLVRSVQDVQDILESIE